MVKKIGAPVRRDIEDKCMKDMRSRVFQHMLKTRGWKYRAFLRYLRLFKYAAFSPTRGEFLESYYTLMRYLDDVVDGDAPLPPEYPDEASYILQKIEFSKLPLHPEDEVDYLMCYCFEVADRFGADFREETSDILNSLLFDARRRGHLEIFPHEELSNHFHKMDIRGTIRATLKVFNEDPDKYLFLEPLGMASRYQFDLEDFEADIAAGYVNISREECDQWGITRAHLYDSSSLPIRRWFRWKAEAGLALLEEHHRRLPQGRFSLLSRATFPLVYEAPARKRFMQVLRECKV
ncbi:hypothetical protein [Flavilitoribacter nigricans]|uniref:Squalene synthase HpnC n=1 Tax=Flavilitoribacter nigricans (strain ATCC 23147 / DSM 23189 / NBRC 102662 / NCIMB 1420 / SS-2) TaxID=1122177 RepID=A0A2D0NAH2_FLAN2|nr:hypothetical protein [Flavilitoribacter nigricans]PHN05511.1 hypothetical protein CRP01_16070 [Flavilitoribacter nigricans DSM 23189 = NBRC 102662]